LSRDRLVRELFSALKMAKKTERAESIVAVVKELGVLSGLRVEQTDATVRNLKDDELESGKTPDLTEESERLRAIIGGKAA
jgi:hypothetical protein